jgi:hypothetical protein
LLDSHSGSLGARLAIVGVLWHVSNQSVSALVVSLIFEETNVAMLGEQLTGLLLIERVGQVLDVDVVEHTSELTSVSWLVLDSESAIVASGVSEAVGGGLWLLEAHESVATGRVVWVEGDLEGLDFTVLGELLLEPLRVVNVILGDLGHKHVVLDKACLVAAEQLVVVGEGAAHLAVDLEVSKLLAGLLESLLVWDNHDGGVEGTINVASELRLAIENNASSLLDQSGDVVGSDVLLGEIVHVEVVLLLCWVVDHLDDCFFVFEFLELGQKGLL